ncbi:MAG: RES family NAD+ phosphorylase [Candidatus Sulfotelmatobacter sp.]
MLGTTPIDQRDTHRLIPAQFADGGASVLTRLTDDPKTLEGIFELDNATNDRLLAESRLSPGIDERELVFGIPSYRIINAAFCHPSPTGSRFNSADRGAWYASFELETSQAEVAYHRQLWLRETAWEEEDTADYLDYLADFRAEFHDLHTSTEHVECLSPTSYAASQALAAQLLELGSAGIVYPCVRRAGGTCLVCFRPVLVTNVRKGSIFTFTFPDSHTPPRIRRA